MREEHGRYTYAPTNTCIFTYTCTTHYRHLGTNIFKSLFRSQFDEIKCAQGGTITVAASSTLVGHILVAPVRACGCHSQQQMGSLAKMNEQHLWKKQSWEIAMLACDKKHPWGIPRGLWGCILSRKNRGLS